MTTKEMSAMLYRFTHVIPRCCCERPWSMLRRLALVGILVASTGVQADELRPGDILYTVRGDDIDPFSAQRSGLYFYRSDNFRPDCNIPRFCSFVLYEGAAGEVVVDSQGRIFFISGGVARYLTASRSIQIIAEDHLAQNLAVGPDDYLYFTSYKPFFYGDSVFRLDPDTGLSEYLFEIPNSGLGIKQIAVGIDGDVFVAAEGLTDGSISGEILRWDSQTEVIEVIVIGACQQTLELCSVSGLASKGASLFASDFTDDKTLKINPTTGVVEQEVQSPGRAGKVAAGPDNSVYVVTLENPFQQSSRDGVYKVNFDTNTGQYIFGVLTSIARMQGIAMYQGPTTELGYQSPLLLRHSGDNRWFTYAVSLNGLPDTIEDRGRPDLPRNPAYQTVSRDDFNGDGTPDVLLRDMTGAANGRWQLTTLVGSTVTSQGSVDLARNQNWQIASTEDFDGNGKADVLLHNVVDGRWQMNLLDSQTVVSKAFLAITADLTDTLVGAEDFDGDGVTDLLLRRVDGSWLMYLMDGVNTPIESTPPMTPNPNFSVLALEDFNGDGRTDVLLRRNDGRWFSYLLDGGTILDSGSLLMTENTAFSFMSAADFSGDGNADVLLRRTDGRWFLYSLDGLSILTEGPVDMTRNPEYEIVSDNDVNGDGMADLLLRRSDGRWVLYSIDGNVPAVNATGNPDMTRNTDWAVQ